MMQANQQQQAPPQQYQMGPPPPVQQWPQMMAAPQFQVTPPQAMMTWQQQQQVTSQSPAQGDEIKTLWIGDLQFWMDENYLNNCFAQTGELVSAKVIRSRQSGQSEGYGFIEFATRGTAERVLQTFNGQIMPNTEQAFRLNWAAAGEKRGDDGPEYTVFVGDLAPDVTDYVLQETFKSHYPSVRGAKIVTDRTTGRSKGYGFVKFADLNEQTRAMTEMDGQYCSTRQMRVGPATNKKSMGLQQNANRAPYQNSQASESDNDPNNTTVFVGGLDPNVTDDLLRQVFSAYGEVVNIKIPLGKRCGFVQFANRANAQDAIDKLNGTTLGGQSVRLSWGRTPNKQPQQDQNQYNSNYYGYNQGYETYGYQQPQDPNMYAYAPPPPYQGYGGNYQQQQQ